MGLTIAFAALLAVGQQQQEVQQLIDQIRGLLSKIEILVKPQQPSTGIVAEPGRWQATLDAAPVGAIVLLRGGIEYREHVVVRKSVTIDTLGLDLPAGQRVTDADKLRMAHVVPVNNGPLIDVLPGVADVTVRRLWLGPSNANAIVLCGHADGTQTTLDQQPRRINFLQMVVEGDDRPGAVGAKRGIELSCRDVVVADGRIADVRRVGQDTQAIGGWNTEGNITIRNNYLEAAGENVMLGGAAPSIPGVVPRNVQILDNHVEKDPAWRLINATVKNHVEAKVVDGLLIKGNRVENTWAAGQAYTVMLTPQAQDAANPNCVVANVTIEDNEFIDVSGGIVIKGRQQLGTPCLPGGNFAVRRNWFQIRRTFNGGAGQGWPFFLSGEPRDVVIENNTVDHDANHFIYQENGPLIGLIVRGNLFNRGWAYGMAGTVNGTQQHYAIGLATWAPGAVVSGNGIVGFSRPANLPNNLHVACLQWNADRTSCLQVPPGLVVGGYGAGELAAYGRPR